MFAAGVPGNHAQLKPKPFSTSRISHTLVMCIIVVVPPSVETHNIDAQKSACYSSHCEMHRSQNNFDSSFVSEAMQP